VSPADTSVANLLLWVSAASLVLSFCTAVWTIFSGPSKKNSTKIDTLTDKVAAIDRRLGDIEQSQRALPSKDDMHELELAMERLKGEMKTLSQVMNGQSAIMERMEAIVARHEDHLLKK
jgi:hypothetical protein